MPQLVFKKQSRIQEVDLDILGLARSNSTDGHVGSNAQTDEKMWRRMDVIGCKGLVDEKVWCHIDVRGSKVQSDYKLW